MRIEHIAIWVKDLESMKDFYCKYFNAVAGKKYTNPKKKFESYFLSFDDGGRLELMSMPDIPVNAPTMNTSSLPGLFILRYQPEMKER